MASTRKKNKDQFEQISANIPLQLSRKSKLIIKELNITLNSVIQASFEDFIDWNGKPRWIVERELVIHDKKFRLGERKV